MRVLKMSAADPEIHSWVNRAGGDVFISGFMVTLTYVMDLRWGVGQEKRPKGLPSISGPAKTKASGALRCGVGGRGRGRCLSVLEASHHFEKSYTFALSLHKEVSFQ